LSEGAYVWLIPDGYIPEESTATLLSHESICVLNAADEQANLSITFYFEDRDPIRDVRVTVAPERTRHIRTDLPEHLGGATVPKGVPYAVRVACDVPVTVQHSRVDTSQEALALMTTMAHPVR
jgi:hypothetical protein